MSDASVTAAVSTSGSACRPGSARRQEASRFGIFSECPQCGGDMAPEHAHYRCGGCGWRDSCCD
jgi:hypothetical protein